MEPQGRQPFQRDNETVLPFLLPSWKSVNECQCHWDEIGGEGGFFQDGTFGWSPCFSILNNEASEMLL